MPANNDEWPFDDPPDVAVFTLRQIMQDGAPVLHVTHDEEDGAWQFLELESPDEADVSIVGLAEILMCDPGLRELADLPLGWHAWRVSVNTPWMRAPNVADDTEET